MNDGAFNQLLYNHAETILDSQILLEKSYRCGFGIFIDGAGDLRAGFREDLPPYGPATLATSPGTHVVVIRRSGGSVSVAEGNTTGTGSGSSLAIDGGAMRIGLGAEGLSGFTGDIAEVGIYDRALTDLEVSQLVASLSQKY